MCGLSGVIDASRRQSGDALRELALRMAQVLHHRGPDDVGSWVDAAAGVALSHRRLAILDLSPLGHQPMQSSCGRYVASFNGEIYNFRTLRAELERLGHRFRSHSDTEIMLSCFSQWGVESAIPKLNGMFAIAVWDRDERVLHLIRDRMGEKPLYYGWTGKTFLFASELKAFRRYPAFHATIDRDAVALLMRHGYVPAPYSIYTGVAKVLPGTVVTIAPDPGVAPRVRAYWSVTAAAEKGSRDRFRGTAEEAIAELDGLLKDAVRLRMEADVPLGAFLSGGIDSSTIVALMQAQRARPVRTFSIGFHEGPYNEAPHAKAVAAHLGTDHTELYVTSGQAIEVIPQLATMYDEPFADSSQIPTYLVSALAKRHVTVALSGDGGDEIFCGYDRYFLTADLWNKIGVLPYPLRKLAARALRAPSPATWAFIFRRLAPVLLERFQPINTGHLPHRLAEMLTVDSLEALYLSVVSLWKRPTVVVPGASEPPTVLTDAAPWPPTSDPFERMMLRDMLSYLPDDILVKVDRASMAVSLEARVPFLDHRVVEWAWRLPLSMKMRHGRAKWILRQVLHRYVPPALVDRPKMGFGVPIDSWLRGPLREWAESLLDEKRVADDGIFDAALVREKWQAHVSGEGNWHYYLWPILMFQGWFEQERDAAQSRQDAALGWSGFAQHYAA